MKLIDNSNAKIFTIGTIVLTTLGVLIKVLDNGSEKLASPNTDNTSSNTVPETYKTSSSSNTSMQNKAEDTPLNDIDHENKTEKNIGEDKSIYINKINKIEEILQDAKEQIEINKYNYALNEIRVSLEIATKCIIQYYSGEPRINKPGFLCDLIAECKDYLDYKMFSRLCSANKICSSTQHDGEERYNPNEKNVKFALEVSMIIKEFIVENIINGSGEKKRKVVTFRSSRSSNKFGNRTGIKSRFSTYNKSSLHRRSGLMHTLTHE